MYVSHKATTTNIKAIPSIYLEHNKKTHKDTHTHTVTLMKFSSYLKQKKTIT